MTYSIRQNPAYVGNYTKGRNGSKINKVVVHHAATTDFDGIGRTFQKPGRNASAHYGVGRNGNVDQYVQESDMAWHAGTRNPATNPNPSSIGIENVNMTGGPDWLIDDATFNTLVELVYDISVRNGLLPLVVGKNLFQHKNFAPTYCAGKVGDRINELAERVNAMSGNPTPPPTPGGPDQVLNVGEKFKFKDSYRVDDLQLIGGTWQVRTNELCPKGFTWNDNGIPVGPLTEVSGGVGNPNDQRLQVGSRYSILGTFTVLDIGRYQDRWLAKIKMGGWTLWVDVETVTEV